MVWYSSKPKKPCKLADVYQNSWVLNPDGCSFRAGLQRTLSDQGLVPRPLLERSAHREQLAVMPLKDFKPVMDLWLIYPHFLGNLQGPVDAFGKRVAGEGDQPLAIERIKPTNQEGGDAEVVIIEQCLSHLFGGPHQRGGVPLRPQQPRNPCPQTLVQPRALRRQFNAHGLSLSSRG